MDNNLRSQRLAQWNADRVDQLASDNAFMDVSFTLNRKRNRSAAAAASAGAGGALAELKEGEDEVMGDLLQSYYSTSSSSLQRTRRGGGGSTTAAASSSSSQQAAAGILRRGGSSQSGTTTATTTTTGTLPSVASSSSLLLLPSGKLPLSKILKAEHEEYLAAKRLYWQERMSADSVPVQQQQQVDEGQAEEKVPRKLNGGKRNVSAALKRHDAAAGGSGEREGGGGGGGDVATTMMISTDTSVLPPRCSESRPTVDEFTAWLEAEYALDEGRKGDYLTLTHTRTISARTAKAAEEAVAQEPRVGPPPPAPSFLSQYVTPLPPTRETRGRHRTCSVCMKPAAPYVCPQCTSALFCSTECFDLHDAMRCLKHIV